LKSSKFGLIGSGNRIKSIYLPVFKSSGIEVSGFTTRSQDKGELFANETGLKFYSTTDEMVADSDLEYFLVAVSMSANAEVVNNLLKFGKPIIVETPLAWSKKQTKNIVDKANILGVKIYVMEQFPFLPIELLRHQLYKDGVFGNIYAVHNDFSAYKYHGIARARQYLNSDAKQLSSQTIKFNLASPKISNNPSWQMANIEFSDGARLFHVFCSEYWGNNMCHPSSFRIYGEKASMTDDKLNVLVDSCSDIITAKVLRESTEGGSTKRLSISIPEFKDYVWENPYSKDEFSDEQTAVAVLLNSILTNGENGILPYTASQFAIDIEIDQAINISASRDGAYLTFPLNEKKQQLLKLTSYKFWKNKIKAN
jgi:hypothetical protein